MTPQEISDHKRKWIMASYYESHVHSDYRIGVKTTAFSGDTTLKDLQNPMEIL